jgi:hypothetical protein
VCGRKLFGRQGEEPSKESMNDRSKEKLQTYETISLGRMKGIEELA